MTRQRSSGRRQKFVVFSAESARRAATRLVVQKRIRQPFHLEARDAVAAVHDAEHAPRAFAHERGEHLHLAAIEADAHLDAVADQTHERRRGAVAAVDLHLRLVRPAPLGVKLHADLHALADIQHALTRERGEGLGDVEREVRALRADVANDARRGRRALRRRRLKRHQVREIERGLVSDAPDRHHEPLALGGHHQVQR